MSKKKPKYKVILNSQGVTRGEDLLKPEGRETLEQYKARTKAGHEAVAQDQEDWEALCKVLPLSTD